MKLKIAFLIAGSGLALVFALKAEPTPTPTPPPIKIPGKPKPPPIKIPGKPTPTPKPPPIKIPGKPTPTPKPPPIKIPGKPTPTPKPPPIKIPGKPTPTPKPPPIKIPGKVTPTPTVGPIKIPGKVTPTPTMGPIKIPGKKITPTPTVGPIKIPGKKITPTVGPIKIPGKKIAPEVEPPFDKKKDGTGKNDVHFWSNIDVNPPPPSQLGPALIIPSIPVYQAVPASPVNYVPGGVALVPETYNPPPQNAPTEISPTALRAWNGEEEPPGRAFDQTRVNLSGASEGTASWQFFWQTTGPEPQAARWEVATVPFVGGSTEFPPAGLVGYGDASVNAATPLTESFFAVDFNGFAKNFKEGSVPNKYYMRVVPVDGEGNPVGKPSNFVRIDLP